MLFEFIKQPLVMMFLCALLVFAEMFIAKKWFTSFTAKINSAKARRGANFALGLVTCHVLALSQMAALCDVFHITWLWQFAIGSAFIATFIYISLEKIFGESEVNNVGKIFCEIISHSNQFDGGITKSGMVDVARKMYSVVNGIDEASAAKEKKAIDDVVARLDSFLSDGKVTDDEKAEAKKIVGESAIDNSLLQKYAELLK
ncbi:MAG: hypothetical protein J6J71_04640 [Prevotella sp.]|nr:hypothetical protein [Prevotella sp.]